MKKIIPLVFFTLALFVTSCTENPEAKLVGKWVGSTTNEVGTTIDALLILNSDKTGRISLKSDGFLSIETECEIPYWKATSDEIVMEQKGYIKYMDTQNSIDKAATVSYELDKNKLILREKNGSTTILVKEK